MLVSSAAQCQRLSVLAGFLASVLRALVILIAKTAILICIHNTKQLSTDGYCISVLNTFIPSTKCSSCCFYWIQTSSERYQTSLRPHKPHRSPKSNIAAPSLRLIKLRLANNIKIDSQSSAALPGRLGGGQAHLRRSGLALLNPCNRNPFISLRVRVIIGRIRWEMETPYHHPSYWSIHFIPVCSRICYLNCRFVKVCKPDYVESYTTILAKMVSKRMLALIIFNRQITTHPSYNTAQYIHCRATLGVVSRHTWWTQSIMNCGVLIFTGTTRILRIVWWFLWGCEQTHRPSPLQAQSSVDPARPGISCVDARLYLPYLSRNAARWAVSRWASFCHPSPVRFARFTSLQCDYVARKIMRLVSMWLMCQASIILLSDYFP